MLVKNIGIAQGSFYHIQYLSEDGESYQTQIDSILLEIDSSLSIYKKYSIISRLNNQEYINTDEMFNEVYAAAKSIYIQTEGSFDCSVYPLVKEWGFYKDFSGDSVVVDSLIFRNILPNIGFNKIHLIQTFHFNLLGIHNFCIRYDIF